MDEIKAARIMALYEAGNASLEKKDYRDAFSRYRMIIKEAETIYEKEGGRFYSFEHPLDVVLFRYFQTAEDAFQEAELPMSRFYRKLGITQIHLKDYEGALRSFDASSHWNPADADMMLRVAELHKRAGRPDSARKAADDAYHYCFTRAEMARYYRCYGFFYLEKYKPELAAALYQYSMLYYPSQSAEQELTFLYRAMNKDPEKLSTEQLIDTLNDLGLPLGPDNTTIGLIYQFGMQSLEGGSRDLAKQCLSLVYDITADEETAALLAGLEQDKNEEEPAD